MQKKLIALAVAGILSAPLAAQADATVKLTGKMDLGFLSSKSQSAGVDTTTNTMGNGNGSQTSNVAITATEDLGGGLSVKGYIESDPTLGTNKGAAFANAPNYVMLNGSFGSVGFGYINNYALSASSASQPLGTGMGSGYNGAWGRLDGANNIGDPAQPTTAKGAGTYAGARDIRSNHTFQYQTPNMSGFSAGLQYKIGNSDAGAAAVDAVGVTQIGLMYSGGPIHVVFANSAIEDKSAGGTIIGTSNKVTHNMIGANYSLGQATIYGGYTTSKASTSADTDSSSYNVAVKFAFSDRLDGMANYVKVDDKTTANVDRDLIGLGVDYAMSKQTTAYARYAGGDNNKASGNDGKFTRFAVGLVQVF